jgi:hypothetical protein
VGWWGLLQKDSLEKILSIIFMLIACIQLSYSVNTVGEIISALNRAEEECKRRMRVVNRYMNGQRISFGL